MCWWALTGKIDEYSHAMSIAYTTIPFEQCDTDSQTVTSTGGTIAAIFTNLAFTKGRDILLQNRGAVDLLIGKTAATARWHILPDSIFSCSPKDLTKLAIKSSGASLVVDIFLVT